MEKKSAVKLKVSAADAPLSDNLQKREDVIGRPISDSISNKIHQVKIRVNSIREKEHPKVLIIFVF